MVVMPEPIARDDNIWQGHPDVAYHAGRVFIVWRESDRHLTSGGTRIKMISGVITEYDTLRYSKETVIAESTHRLNCPRISIIDDRLWVVCDEIQSGPDFISAENDRNKTHVIMWASNESPSFDVEWEGPIHTNIRGIVPDRLMKFRSAKILATHTKKPIKNKVPAKKQDTEFSTYEKEQSNGRLVTEFWTQQSGAWKSSKLADVAGLNLCEASILNYKDLDLLCLMRENSGHGLPAYWCTSNDGSSWSSPKETRLFGCHRPVWGLLPSGNILVTYREQSSVLSKRCWARNTFATLIQTAGQNNIINPIMEEANILSLDHDRSATPDGGYTGWVQLDDGRIFVVNYITDDAPKPYIRGYILREEDFILGSKNGNRK